MWIFINGFEYKRGEWKHIMHKEVNQQILPTTKNQVISTKRLIKCPAMYFHPNFNTIRVYVNTYNSKNEYVDIGNIPVNKWYSTWYCFVVRNSSVDVMINGFVKKDYN